MTTLQPRIYVICRETYRHERQLHGVWIEANQDVSSLNMAIEKMLASSPMDAFEWKIHDSKGFGGWNIELEDYDIEMVSEIAKYIVANGELGAGLIEYARGDIEYAESLRKEYYCGEYDSEIDFVEKETIVNDFSYINISDDARPFIDWRSLAAEWFKENGNFFSIEANNKTHVFWLDNR